MGMVGIVFVMFIVTVLVYEFKRVAARRNRLKTEISGSTPMRSKPPTEVMVVKPPPLIERVTQRRPVASTTRSTAQWNRAFDDEF